MKRERGERRRRKQGKVIGRRERGREGGVWVEIELESLFIHCLVPHSAYSVITLKVQSNHNSHSGRTRALSALPMFATLISF